MSATYIFNRAESRFKTKTDWLTSYHSFSFAEHYDPRRMGFGALRVLNDDTIAPEQGFGAHSHRDMEIITIPFSGKLMHKDNIGNTSSIDSSMVQIMSAGTGITHAEWNNEKVEPVALFQIWIEPQERGFIPRYEERVFDQKLYHDTLYTFIDPQGSSSRIKIFQEAYLSRGRFTKVQEITYSLQGKNTGVYLVVIEGSVVVDGMYALKKRDALGVTEAKEVVFKVEEGSDILLIEVPIVG